MKRGPLHILATWLDAAEVLRSIPPTLGYTALVEIISEVCGALGVGVDVFTDPTKLVKLPNGNDGLPAYEGVLNYHGIRGSKFTLEAVVSALFGVSSPQSPEVVLSRDAKTNFEKYSEGVRSRPDIRFIFP
jgi:hypothetical protein